MSKTNEKLTTNKEEKGMKAKANKSEKTTTKNTKENKAMSKEIMTIIIDGTEVTGTQEQIKEFINSYVSKESETKTKATKKATKATTKGKSSAKRTATVTENKTATTRKEALRAKYPNYDQYGEVAKEVKAEMMADNAKMLKANNGVYPKEYYVGAKWKKEFERRMKARGFAK